MAIRFTQDGHAQNTEHEDDAPASCLAAASLLLGSQKLGRCQRTCPPCHSRVTPRPCPLILGQPKEVVRPEQVRQLLIEGRKENVEQFLRILAHRLPPAPESIFWFGVRGNAQHLVHYLWGSGNVQEIAGPPEIVLWITLPQIQAQAGNVKAENAMNCNAGLEIDARIDIRIGRAVFNALRVEMTVDEGKRKTHSDVLQA